MKKGLSVLLLIFVMIIVLRLVGFTYGFYAANIINNTKTNSVSLVSQNLSVEYLDGTSIMNFEGDYLFPGDSAEKTFTVKNTGTDKTTYNILIDNVKNEFERTQDLRYDLYINDELLYSGAINNNDVQYLYTNREIGVGDSDSIRFVFRYATTDEIQNVDMNKTISFRFNIDTNLINNSEGVNSVNLYGQQNINNYRIYGNSIQSLPRSYQRVDYVEHNNQGNTELNAYIDTGIVATSEIDAEIDFLMSALQNAFKIPFGVIGNNANFAIGFNSNASGNAFVKRYANDSGYVSSTTAIATSNTRFKLRLNKSGAYYNDELILENTAASFDSGLNIYLGGLNINGKYNYSYSSSYMRFYGFKLYDNSVLVRDFVPSYRASDKVAGFYDLVGNNFYTSNNEHSFVAGSDLKEASAEYPIKILNVGDYDKESGKYIVSIVFNGETINIALDEPLRKVGEYVDYIDFKQQAVVRNVMVVDDTGTLSIEESYKGLDIPVVTPLNLPSISTNIGSNIIEIDSAVSPSNIYIEY